MENKNTNIIFELFTTKEDYLAFRKAWADNFNTNLDKDNDNPVHFSATDFFIYALLRGKDPRKCFHNEDAYQEHLSSVEWYMKNPRYLDSYLKKYGETVTTEMLIRAFEHHKSQKGA